MYELKPCPFCNGSACVISTGNYYPKEYYRIVCQKSCTMQAKLYETKEKAIEAWNRRAGEQE